MKVLVVESNALFREAIGRTMAQADGVSVVGQIDRVHRESLLGEVTALQPDLVLVGVGVADTATLGTVMHIMDGDRSPSVVLHGRSLTLPAAHQIAETLRNVDGGFAYLDSDRIQSIDALLAVCRVVAERMNVVDPPTMHRLLGLIDSYALVMSDVSSEERSVLERMSRGESDEVIAAFLGINPEQVAAKIDRIAAKFGVDAAGRDARVTTTLRYLVATGSLPIDYDTGTPARNRATSLEGGPAEWPGEGAPFREAAPPMTDEPEQEAHRWTNELSFPGDQMSTHDQRNTTAFGPAPIADAGPATSGVPGPGADTAEDAGRQQRDDDGRGPFSGDTGGFRSVQEGLQHFNEFARFGKQADVAVAGNILRWAAGRGLRVRWGARSSEGSYSLVLDAGSLSYWLLTVWAIGTVEVQFAMMLAQPPFDDFERRKEIAARLNRIRGVSIDDTGLSGRPRVPLSSLLGAEDWSYFTEAMDWVIEVIRQSGQASGAAP